MPTPSIKTIILRITLIIALVELMIMLMLGGLSHDLTAPLHAMLDALILVSLSTPIIYLWVIKPYVIARDEAVQKVTHMAFHDPLTQLANRHLISEYLEKVLNHIERYKVFGALLFVDLDGFKSINDKYGHDTGDAILIEMAIRLQANTRGDDTVGRFGGDEFIIILSQLDTDLELARDIALQVAQRVQAAIKEPVELHENFQLDASIGVRMLVNESLTVDTIVKEADIAMYRAKQAGKGCAVFFE